MRQHDPENRTSQARDALRRIQQRLRAFTPVKVLVSDELIAERRAEERAEFHAGLESRQTPDD